MSERKVVLIRESLFQSVMSDIGTFCMVCGIIGLGVFLESPAMQWVGFVFALLVTLSAAYRKQNKSVAYGYDDAIKKINELKAENAQ